MDQFGQCPPFGDRQQHDGILEMIDVLKKEEWVSFDLGVTRLARTRLALGKVEHCLTGRVLR